MGNTHIKPHPRQRNKKQVHWKAAARPYAPGKPYLVSDGDITPDLVTIRWNKPIADGGSPISGYLVEHRRTGSPHWVRATPLLVQFNELTISGLEPGWRYQFRISAENAVGLSDPSELSEPITVTLQRSAVTSPRITQEIEDTVALENKKVEFVVHFLGQPAPKVCWYKDAFEIFSSRRIRILTEIDRSVLTIHQCALSDEGEIKCSATNRAGHVSTKCKLTVNAAPNIRLPRQYEDGLLFEIGELIRLKVSVAGRPTPLVLWSHDGESIKNNDRYEIEHIDNASILKINNAQRSDRGEYSIKAVNQLGEDTQSFLVTVTDKPSAPGKARVVMALGRTVTLSWGTPQDDGGCKIGNYIVEYYRLGWDVWLKAATSRQLTTILGDLIEGSQYKFRIKAESPYGISEPSEESDVIFIPDTKRGILQPPPRSKSQSREIEDSVVTPTRRRKNYQRSTSPTQDSNLEKNDSLNDIDLNIPPKRPMRNKIKSPSKTPEASPLPIRKDLETPSSKRDLETKLNKEIFERSDRSSVARDLAYGSPDIKVKRELEFMSSLSSNISSTSEKSRTPSPAPNVNDHKVFTVKIESPQQDVSRKTPPPSPEMRKLRLPQENSENLAGSSEFMLVLYTDGDHKDDSDFDFGDVSIPPPMSLSAPELGTDAQIFNSIKASASSSELLHERAMNRLYEAAKAEEEELEKKRKSIESKGLNIEIPKIQINSRDTQEKSELERLHSLKRRLSGGNTQQLLRRFSARYNDNKGDNIVDLQKSNLTQEQKKALMMTRQRSNSEELEEIEFEKVRAKMSLKMQMEKRKIDIVDVEKWSDDYVSSTEESSFEEEYDEEEGEEKDNQNNIKKISYYTSEDEEEATYHPKGLRMMSYNDKEPFEILTKRKQPPSPDFIPKPILKRREHDGTSPLSLSPPTSPKKTRSPSPMPSKILQKEISLVEASLNLPLLQKTIPEEEPTSNARPRSLSLIPYDETFMKFQGEAIPVKQRQRAFSLLPQVELFQKEIKEDKPLTLRQRSFSLIPPDKGQPLTPENIYDSKPTNMSFIMQTISAAATITGITAASVVIPDRLYEKQKDAEEAKVVVDHYSDIVRSFGNKSKKPYQHQSREPLQSKESLTKIHKTEDILNTSYLDTNMQEVNAGGKLGNPITNNYQNTDLPINSGVIKQTTNSNITTNYHDTYPPYTANTKKEFSVIENSSTNTEHNMTSTFTSNETPTSNKSLNTTIFDPETAPNPQSPNRISLSPLSQIHNDRHSKSSIQSESSSSNRDKNEKTENRLTRITPSRKKSPSPMRKQEKRKTASPYPINRNTSTSPDDMDHRNYSPIKKRTSPSPMRKIAPSPVRLRPPKMKEIMTQTSESLASFDAESYNLSLQFSKQEELMVKTEVKVHRFVDYLTDLVMFLVACWLYLFKNELYAIPVLIILAYRQLQAEIAKLIPNWLVRMMKRKKK